MARKIRIVTCIVAIILLSIVELSGLTNLTERKSSDFKYQPFFEEKNDFDVLFMGTSHVINAIFPMELWNDYGITSYNFGGHGNELATTYWVLKNALDYTTPKLVVIDCLKLGSEAKVCTNIEYAHYSFDAFPLTINKIKAINDLFESGNKQEMLWDFTVYHSRWNELNDNDLNLAYNKEKGAEYRVAVAIPEKYDVILESEKTFDHTMGAEYLRKMIEECQERGIEVILTYLPFPADSVHQMDANLAYDIANEYGIDYINFLKIDDIINLDTDCYDPNSHLNGSGGRKVTEYLGEYINSHCDLPDHRQDEAYSKWNEDYKKYTEFKFNHLKQQDNLDKGLMLLADKNMSSCVYFKGGSEALQDQRTIKLIKNIVPQSKLMKLEQAIKEKGEYLFIVDRQVDEIVEILGEDEASDIITSFGKVSRDEQGINLIDNNGKKIQLNSDQNGNCVDISVIAIDKIDNMVQYEGYFNLSGVDKNNNLVGNKVK